MKTGKLFTLDIEIAEKLKNLNASKLVNTLLKEHFDARGGKNTLKEQKKAVYDAISKKKERFLKKLGFLRRGMRSIWTFVRGIGSKTERTHLVETKLIAILPTGNSKLPSTTSNVRSSSIKKTEDSSDE